MPCPTFPIALPSPGTSNAGRDDDIGDGLPGSLEAHRCPNGTSKIACIMETLGSRITSGKTAGRIFMHGIRDE